LSDQEKWEMWEQRIANFEASNKSAAEWCRENGVANSTFCTWKQKVQDARKGKQEEVPAASWVEITTKEEEKCEPEATMTVRIGEIAIEVKAGYDEQLLQSLIRTVLPLC
jgi:hypothetical protein